MLIFFEEAPPDAVEESKNLVTDPYVKIRKSFLKGALIRWRDRARESLQRASLLRYTPVAQGLSGTQRAPEYGNWYNSSASIGIVSAVL